MIEFLKHIDTKLFLLFNGHPTPFMDTVMGIVGNKFTWIPLYLLLLYFVWKKAKSSMWLVLLSVAVLIICSDQISVHLFKETFQRYRPCHNLLLKDKIHLINGQCGALYGFVSSHAANTFALFSFLALFFRKPWFILLMYLWASLVSYSRVYAGVHYPFDVVGGMMLGVMLGILGYKIYARLDKKYV